MFVLLIITFFTALFSVSTFAGASNYTTSSRNEFITYENSTEGIKIDYPEGWTAIRQYGLAFLSPKENDSDTFREGLVVARGSIVNESIDKLADRVLKFYNSSLIDFRLNESKGTTIHGNPARSLIYTFTIPDNGTIKALDLGTRENNRVHVFRYTAQESKFDSYLPTIERMIDSYKGVE
jgi:eukaryotic-like serine/threonine-protein kinase